MKAVDTHSHIHSKDYVLDAAKVYEDSIKLLEFFIVCGEDVEDSRLAVNFSTNKPGVFASVGIHPHEASNASNVDELRELAKQDKVVAIGECGLDFWYMHSDKAVQIEVLTKQIEIAQELDLPLIFHVRGEKERPSDIFNEFFMLIDSLNNRGKKIRGVIHSFTSGQKELEGVLSRGLAVGFNGILTFTKDEALIDVGRTVPHGSFVLETDSPYLTPTPNRGKVNVPKNVVDTAMFLAEVRGESLNELLTQTNKAAKRLFNI